MALRVSFRLGGLFSETRSIALQHLLSKLPGIRVEQVLVGIGGAPGQLAVIVDGKRTTERELRAALSNYGFELAP